MQHNRNVHPAEQLAQACPIYARATDDKRREPVA